MSKISTTQLMREVVVISSSKENPRGKYTEKTQHTEKNLQIDAN